LKTAITFEVSSLNMNPNMSENDVKKINLNHKLSENICILEKGSKEIQI